MAARILDFMDTGSPCLLPDLAAFLASCSWAALHSFVSPWQLATW